VLITLALALPAAYSLAQLPVRWGSGLGVAIFMVYLVPPSLLFISLSKIVSVLDLQDTRWSRVLVDPTLTVPVAVWLLLGFFKAVPRDIEDQALVDGYSRVATFWRVAVPLALPGIVAVVVFAFTLAAHEFIYALAFVSPTNERTISVGVPTELIRANVFFWQSLEAAGIIIAIPLAFAFTLLLERFIMGFAIGAVKG
jgi:multiple sugar transport system permease protein